ncbi:MAG: Mandelate racemase/muconate lactonizing protein [Bacteroidetes bacterium]|nr:MAG: Mandelate racemase/muconate lactonizing protein [Bacteroidota bacterium]
MLKAKWISYSLNFKFPAGTSRGVLVSKPSWFLKVIDLAEPDIFGIGEVSVIPGLSLDDEKSIGPALDALCSRINDYGRWLEEFGNSFPAICFGLETALTDLKSGGNRVFFKNTFTQGNKGIPVNGLIWMGNFEEMRQRISAKLSEGFRVIKLKVGAIDFESEVALLSEMRQLFSPDELTIRLDANGAFAPDMALEKLKRLSDYHIHSIEQPIKSGQHEQMAELCSKSPVPIALDEELIGVYDAEAKMNLLETLRPEYIILKPGLLGGFGHADEWIRIAEKLKIGWWATSALESNIGLNAIAQWTFNTSNPLTQGLGTGQLFHNNIGSPLEIRDALLYHNPENVWNLQPIL